MLEDLKEMLGFAEDDTGIDKKLNLILHNARQRLKNLLGGINPPSELDYIILDVAVIRFNRIGSEGLDAHTVEGESLSFSENDFEGFSSDIQAWLNSQSKNTRGKVRFI